MKLATILITATLATASAASAGGLNSLDRNGDGGVSASEFLNIYGPDRGIETFRYADRDGNGVIDAEEFRSQTHSSGVFSNL